MGSSNSTYYIINNNSCKGEYLLWEVKEYIIGWFNIASNST